MSIADMPPDKIYKRALKLVKADKLDRAVKLLQIAVLKAPNEGLYRESLNQVRTAIANRDAEPDPTTGTADETDAPAGHGTPADQAASLAEASAEELHAEALVLAEEGEHETAAQLLQLAVAKEPQNGTFRAALEAVRQQRKPKAGADGVFQIGGNDEQARRIRLLMKDQDFEQAENLVDWQLRQDPESASLLFFKAVILFRIHNNPKEALTAAKSSVETDPDSVDSLVLLEQIQRTLHLKNDSMETLKLAIAAAGGRSGELELVRMRLDRLTSAERPTTTTQSTTSESAKAAVIKTAYKRIAGLAAVLLITVGIAGSIWWSQQPSNIDPAPYAAVLPVERALMMPKNTELMLEVQPATWTGLDKAARRSKLEGLLEVATANGFKVVFIQDETQKLLGSAQHKLIYLP